MPACLAIIAPIVNVGAALLPAILAGIASAAAMLLKPRELLRACRRRPYVPVIVLAAGAGVWLSWTALFASPRPTRRRGASAAVLAEGQIDWAKVAMAIIDPDLLWSYYPRWTNDKGKLAEDPNAMILSSPVVRGKYVYGASCTLDPPHNFGAVFCLDAATGRQRWSFDTIDDRDIKGFFSSPAITADGKYLVIGQGLHYDSDCRLICLDAASGKLHWTIPIELHIESSPAVEGDLAVVGAGAIEQTGSHEPVGHGGFVIAVRISDGKELWRYDLADPESSPALVEGVVYIGSGFNGQAVVALRTQSDTELKAVGLERVIWRYPTDCPMTGPVTVVGNLVIAGGGTGTIDARDPDATGAVVALDRATGREVWRMELPDAALGRIVSDGRRIFLPCANGEVIALRATDGKELWRRRISGTGSVIAAPALANGTVYAVSSNGWLARLDVDTGELLGRKIYLNSAGKPGQQVYSVSSPVVVGGQLFVGSETGGLRCYRHPPSGPDSAGAEGGVEGP